MLIFSIFDDQISVGGMIGFIISLIVVISWATNRTASWAWIPQDCKKQIQKINQIYC
jgi:hypothetical protein